jgi:hypothetical protein
MPDNASAQQRGATKESGLERVIDIFNPQPGPPPKPAAPYAKGNHAWEESVEQHHVVPGLTVHEVGLSVFGETKSLHDRPGSNEPIGSARQKLAQAMINDAELSHQTGKKRAIVHPPVKPTDAEWRNPQARAAYESSQHAAREAYLSGHDPTNGATHLNMRPRSDRSNWKFPHGTSEGLTLSTQSGPYDNSSPNKNAPAHTTWVNTYFPDKDDKKKRKQQ